MQDRVTKGVMDQEMATEVGKVCPGSDIEIHQGSIQVKGNRNYELKKWLADMGF